MAEDMGMPEGMTEEQIDAMEDAAGSAAQDAYTTALDGGASGPEAAAVAIEAAGQTMTEMGAPP